MTNMIQSAGKWIWLDNAVQPDSYVVFRKKFTIAAANKAVKMALSADSSFVLYINGQVIPGSQFSDYPGEKTWTCFDISSAVVPGENTAAVMVHFFGDDFLTHKKGYPGLWAVIYDDEKVIESTSGSWLAAPAPGYQSGRQVKFTIQLGFNSLFDAREEGALTWMNSDFDDSGWQNAVDVTACFERSLNERPLPVLIDRPYTETRLVQQGFVVRHGHKETAAEQMFSDYLRTTLFVNTVDEGLLDLYTEVFEVFSTLKPCVFKPDGSGLPFKFRKFPDELSNGYYVIVDLGRETTGFVGFTVKCSAGTVIDYALGEHLESGRVRSYIGIRNLADRFICREGENTFQLRLRRCAGRYLELHFTETSCPPEVLFAGVAEQVYPLENETAFDCSDDLRLKTHAIAVDTLKNCMHEHYEDCPWREQALYAYDSRNQALYGYYIWGNYRFADISFGLIGKSMRPDGFLSLTSPSEFYLTIPVFSFAWISEVFEHFWHSGRLDLFRRNAGVVRQLLDFVLSRPTAGGLYTPGKEKGIWNFSEWVDGLASGEAEEQATYNLYLYEALKKADALFRAAGIEAPDYAAAADVLGVNIEKRFYLPEQKVYASTTGEGADKLLHEHTQALMLFNDLVPEEKIPALLEKIRSGSLIGCSFSSMPFLIRALMRRKEMQDYAAKRVSQAFDALTLRGATTLWESGSGDAIGGDAVSLCHGWSSLPAYFNKRYILGVKPLEPGFKKFSVTPWCGELLRASGEVPTPCGNIKVSWKQNNGVLDLQVEAPEGTEWVK